MTTDEKSLIVGTDLTAVELYTAEKMDVLLEAIREKVESTVLPDTSTDKNRKEIIAFSFEITQTKTMIEKARLKVTEKWREDTKTANQAGKTADEFLTKLAKDTRKSVTKWEEEDKKRKEEEIRIEQARVESIRTQITRMSDQVIAVASKPSTSIQEIIFALEDLQITEEGFAEFRDAAWAAKEDAVSRLRSMRDAVQLQEEEAKRLANKEEERLALVKLDEEQDEAEKKELAPAETPDKSEVPLDVDIGASIDVKEAALIALAIAVGEEAAEIVLDMIIANEVPGVTFNGTTEA